MASRRSQGRGQGEVRGAEGRVCEIEGAVAGLETSAETTTSAGATKAAESAAAGAATTSATAADAATNTTATVTTLLEATAERRNSNSAQLQQAEFRLPMAGWRPIKEDHNSIYTLASGERGVRPRTRYVG